MVLIDLALGEKGLDRCVHLSGVHLASVARPPRHSGGWRRRRGEGGPEPPRQPSTPQFRPNHRPVNNWYFLKKVLIFYVFSKSENLHKNFSLEHQISNLPVVEIYLKRQTKKWPEYPKLRMSWNPL